jgi:hypothetical protein
MEIANMRRSTLAHFWAVMAIGGWGLLDAGHAATSTWVGMNNDWDASNANWDPEDEPDFNDTAIFNTPVSVELVNANESLGGLTMSGGADLDLNGNDMSVNGPVSLSGASTNLLVGPTTAVLTADAITINNGAVLAMRGGTVIVAEDSGDGLVDVNGGGTLSGHGNLSLADGVTAGTKFLINDGTLIATSTALDGGITASTLTVGADVLDARIDLDGDSENGVVSIGRNDTLDIDVPLSDFFSGTIILAAGAKLDISTPLTLNTGDINPNTVGITPGTAGAAATIAGGSFVQTGGTINLDPIDTLRIASFYSANGGVINNDGGKLHLDGGGTIGSGVLVNLFGGGTLQGFATIIADVNGSSSDAPEQLLADNGTLTLNGDFRNVIVGTADEDGILNIPDNWSTNFTPGGVMLAGGELRGGDIDNNHATGIHGHGLISARVNNSTQIVAEGGGTLVLETPDNDNDWDGISDAGILEAATADLEARGSAATAFRGEVVVSVGRRVFANGFALHFLAPSTLSIQGGRYRSTHDTVFGGAIAISAGMATIQIDGVADFTLAQVSLGADLVLDNAMSVIGPAAHFTGAGALINAPGRGLRVFDGTTSAELSVALINRGALEIDQAVPAAHTAAQIQGVDFEQTAEGVWQVDIGGVSITSFDRLSLTGAAVLDGQLELVLFDGYVPALGQLFNILSAAGGVTGAFDELLQPPGMPADLAFDVSYSATIVQLEVVSIPTFSADFDNDGDVDADDLTQWQGDYGLHGDGDADGDGDSDGTDLLAWQQQLGSGLAISPGTAIPEPASRALMAIAAFVMILRQDRKSRVAY